MKNNQLQRIVINSNQKQEQNLILTHDQSHYLYRVLRLKEGDQFIAMDGKGQAWLIEIEQELSELLGIKVDLVTLRSVNASLKPFIEADLIRII
jgi:16S rRNA (uracil1498-N3)-methyltransferase